MTLGARILVAIDPGKRPEDPLTLGVRLARLASAPLELVSVFLTVPMEPDDKFMQEAREATEAQLHEVASRVEGASVAHVRAVGAVSRARGLQQLSEEDDVGLVGHRIDDAGSAAAYAPREHRRPAAERRGIVSGHRATRLRRRPSATTRHPGRRVRRLRRVPALRWREGGGWPARPARTCASSPSTSASLSAASRRPPSGWNRSTPRSSVSSAELLEQAVADDAELSVEGVFEIGRPVDVLVEQTADLDLLMAGSRGYGPLGAVLLGSTTHDLARLAYCPILITPRGRELTDRLTQRGPG